MAKKAAREQACGQAGGGNRFCGVEVVRKRSTLCLDGGVDPAQWHRVADEQGHAPDPGRPTAAPMLSCSSETRIFVATQPVDLRASFNKLFMLTQTVLHQDPLSGH